MSDGTVRGHVVKIERITFEKCTRFVSIAFRTTWGKFNADIKIRLPIPNYRRRYNSNRFHGFCHILLFSRFGREPSTEWLNDWLVPVRWRTVDSIKASLHNDHEISIIRSPRPRNRKIMLIFIWRRAENVVTAVMTLISFGSLLIVLNEQCAYFMSNIVCVIGAYIVFNLWTMKFSDSSRSELFIQIVRDGVYKCVLNILISEKTD